MTNAKFISEVQTLLKFIELYCSDKHVAIKKSSSLDISFKEKNLLHVNYELCPRCKETFLYSLKRLQECPHEPKPRCRKCPKPCYERDKWKYIAKIMRHSGMKLGLLKLKNFLKINPTNK